MDTTDLHTLILKHLREAYINYIAEAHVGGEELDDLKLVRMWHNTITIYLTGIHHSLMQLDTLLQLGLPREDFEVMLARVFGTDPAAADTLGQQINERVKLFQLGEEITHDPE